MSNRKILLYILFSALFITSLIWCFLYFINIDEYQVDYINKEYGFEISYLRSQYDLKIEKLDFKLGEDKSYPSFLLLFEPKEDFFSSIGGPSIRIISGINIDEIINYWSLVPRDSRNIEYSVISDRLAKILTQCDDGKDICSRNIFIKGDGVLFILSLPDDLLSNFRFIEKDDIADLLSCREASDCAEIWMSDISRHICVNNWFESDIMVYLNAVDNGAIESYTDLLEQDCICVREKCKVIPIGIMPQPF